MTGYAGQHRPSTLKMEGRSPLEFAVSLYRRMSFSWAWVGATLIVMGYLPFDAATAALVLSPVVLYAVVRVGVGGYIFARLLWVTRMPKFDDYGTN